MVLPWVLWENPFFIGNWNTKFWWNWIQILQQPCWLETSLALYVPAHCIINSTHGEYHAIRNALLFIAGCITSSIARKNVSSLHYIIWCSKLWIFCMTAFLVCLHSIPTVKKTLQGIRPFQISLYCREQKFFKSFICSWHYCYGAGISIACLTCCGKHLSLHCFGNFF